jgi:hypothetical protein
VVLAYAGNVDVSGINEWLGRTGLANDFISTLVLTAND